MFEQGTFTWSSQQINWEQHIPSVITKAFNMFLKNRQTVLRRRSIPYHINKTCKIWTVYISQFSSIYLGNVLIKFYVDDWLIGFIKSRTVAVNKINFGKCCFLCIKNISLNLKCYFQNVFYFYPIKGPQIYFQHKCNHVSLAYPLINE